MSLRSRFTLGDWTVFPLEGRLQRDGQSCRVQPKSMDVLLCLAEADGEVVERDVLLRRIWGERAVSDEPLTRCVGELRKAFGDTRSMPAYILTVPKRGYRLIPPVEYAAAENKQKPTTPQLTESQQARRLGTIKKLAAGLLILVLAALVQIGIETLLEEPASDHATLQVSATDLHRSIAVLPFVDLSAAQDQEYMSDGIAEEVLNLLARVQQLRVISRSSAFSFKGQSVDVRTIAEQFNVAYVLEGSVRTSGDNIRITAQLIDSLTDTHLWSETYERELHDVFEIQDEIAQMVVSKLEITLLNDAPTSRQTDPEAYALFLQARHLHEQPAGDSFQKAFDFYKSALEIDETYVPAWVWLAALYDDTVYSSGLPRDEVGRLAREAIDRALNLDPEDPLALGMNAVLTEAWQRDLPAAASEMQKAIDLDSSNPIVLRWAANILLSLGQYDTAINVGEFLHSRDPYGSISKINLAATYLMAGENQKAIDLCKIDVALNTESSPCGSRLILAYLYSGDGESALFHLQRLAGSRVYVRLAPMVYHGLDRQDEFNSALRDLQTAYEDGDVGMSYWIARTWAFVGDADTTFEWLSLAHEEGVLDASPRSAFFIAYLDDDRWKSLMEQTGRSTAALQANRLQIVLPD